MNTQKLVESVDHILASDHMRYEFFRNIKYAIKDRIMDNTVQLIIPQYYI
jgi:hypothetical protein